MSRPRSSISTARRVPAAERPLRLDLLANPYGPSVQVNDALAGAGDLHLPGEESEMRLRLRIARLVGVSPDYLTLANGVDELVEMLLLWRHGRGPMVLFPPTDPDQAHRTALHGIETISVARARHFGLDPDPETYAELPPGAAALVASPNDPTGTVLGSQDLVRLVRACELVVVDERHGAYNSRTFVPFAREFENLVVLQTFETWAGLAGLPLAYAVAPPRLSSELAVYRRRGGLAAGAVLAAHATLDDLDYVQATVRRVREERSRLHRTLRKLNMISCPYPSWANFLLARVERGDADVFARELARRDILVHRPPHPELERCLRISATFPEQTIALKRALIEIAAPL